jgi:glycerol-3-phosphate dehydrogenase
VLGIFGGKLTGWRAAAAHVLNVSALLAAAAEGRRDQGFDFEE